jgi:hypothetical protein
MSPNGPGAADFRCPSLVRFTRANRVTSHCGKALGIILPLTLLNRADEVDGIMR